MMRMTMRKTTALIGAAVALALCTPFGAAASDDDGTRWALVARGGVFGIPNRIADEFFVEHPTIDGWVAGFEVRYLGNGGGLGDLSVGLAVDRGSAEGEGSWREEETSRLVVGGGSLEETAITLTAYWTLFPSLPVHPFVGLGIGAAHVTGGCSEDGVETDVSTWIPMVHVPVGLAVELGRHLQLAAEARFLGGFSGGGSLLVRF